MLKIMLDGGRVVETPFMTLAEAAVYTRRSEKIFRTEADAHGVPFERVGGSNQRRYLEADLVVFVRERITTPETGGR